MEIRTSRGVERFEGCRPSHAGTDLGPEEILDPEIESLETFLEEYAEESFVGPGKERISGPQE